GAMPSTEPGPRIVGRASGPGRVPAGRATPVTPSGVPADRITGRASVPSGGGYHGRGPGGRVPGDDYTPALVRRRRPRWGRIALVALVALMLLGGAGAGCLLVYANRLDDNMTRTDAFSSLGERPEKVAPGALNILLLGSDSRDPDGTSGGGPYRADTIMLLH